MKSRQIAEVPGSQGLLFPRWSPDGKYLSAQDRREERIKLYDLRTGRWTELAPPGCTFQLWSRDGKYIQFSQPVRTSGEPGVYRAWIADGKVERIVDLRETKMAGNMNPSWAGMTPEGDPLILESRDSNEIFAFHLEY